MPYFCDVDSREKKAVVNGVTMRTFWGSKMLMSRVDLEPGAILPDHSHPHEQTGIVISGEVEMTIDGETRFLECGDAYIIPAGVRHSATAVDEPAALIDIFSPVRVEYQY